MENELAKNRESADIGDFGNLFMMIQNDSRLGFLVASFIRQAILQRKDWMREVFVQGRPCTPSSRPAKRIFLLILSTLSGAANSGFSVSISSGSSRYACMHHIRRACTFWILYRHRGCMDTVCVGAYIALISI